MADRITDPALNMPSTWRNYTTKDEKPSVDTPGLEALSAYSYKIAPFNSAGEAQN